MGKSKAARIKHHKTGTELTLQQHETESPLIPVGQLKELDTFRPDLIDWVIKKTDDEIAHRQAESHRINTFIFIEKLLGQIFGFIIGILSICCGHICCHES